MLRRKLSEWLPYANDTGYCLPGSRRSMRSMDDCRAIAQGTRCHFEPNPGRSLDLWSFTAVEITYIRASPRPM